MSVIIFPSFVDLAVSATPSSGYALAYDLDGILKQKDQYGNITTLDKGLEAVLQKNNNTGTYSIILATSSTIESSNGYSQIVLDYLNPSTILLSTDSGSAGEGYLLIGTNSVTLSSSIGDLDLSAQENVNIQSKYTNISSSEQFISETGTPGNFTSKLDMQSTSVKIGLYDVAYLSSNNEESIVIFNSSTQSNSTTSDEKWPVLISSRNSTINSSVVDSVILGGVGLTAYSSDTVYLGNSVNINNAYTLPSVDGLNGYVLKTDGSGNVTWGVDSSVQTLEGVLSYGNDTVSYDIIMGTSTFIGSGNSNNRVLLDYNTSILLSTDSGGLSTPYIQVSTSGLTLSTSNLLMSIGESSIDSTTSEGLKYSSDYTSTFVTQSLVSKAYVDSKVKDLESYTAVFVDPTYGNDTSGTIDRFDKPYLTVSAALLGLTSSYSSGLIYLRRGQYTSNIYLRNDINFYCEPGVVFTDGGFSDLLGSADCQILGSAKFEGTLGTLIPLRLENGSTVDFEFDKCDNTNYFARILNSTANIRGNYVNSRSDNGHVISVRGSSDVNIRITDKILGAYKTISVTNNFSGNLILECPEIECETSTGIYGYLVDTSMSLFTDSDTTGNIKVRGSLINSSPEAIYTIPDTNSRHDSSVAIFGGYIKIEGDIEGLNTKGLYVGGTTGVGQVRFRGDVTSYRESVIINSNVIQTYLSDGTLKSWGSGSLPYVVNILATSSTFYLKNATAYNVRNNSSVMYVFSTNSTIGIYDTVSYTNGTSGEFIYTTQSVNVGFHSVRSNKDNNILVTDLFGPSGFIYDTNLFIPNF